MNALCDEERILLITRPKILLHDLDSILLDDDNKNDLCLQYSWGDVVEDLMTSIIVFIVT